MKKAIISGHTRGLGRALAHQLMRDGWDVLGLARTGTPSVDLSDPARLTQWIDSGELQRFLTDATDILLVNNAGMVSPAEVVGHQPADQVIAHINLNVTAALLLTNALVGVRPENSDVRIVHISSGAGRHPYPGWSAYCAAKAALDMHALALAAEQQPGVRVAAIAPGIVDTDMQADIRGSEGFPLRDKFVGYKSSGALTSADAAAAAVLAIIDSPDFGDDVLTDVRG